MSNLDSPEDIKQQQYSIKCIQELARLTGNPIPQPVNKRTIDGAKQSDSFSEEYKVIKTNTKPEDLIYIESTNQEENFNKKNNVLDFYIDDIIKNNENQLSETTILVNSDNQEKRKESDIFIFFSLILIAALSAMGVYYLYDTNPKEINPSTPLNKLNRLTTNTSEFS